MDNGDRGPRLSRRRLLQAVGGVTALGAGVAVDNVLLGYEALGTNLREQDLGAEVTETATSGLRRTDWNGIRVLLWDDQLRLLDGPDGDVLAARRYSELPPAETRQLDDQYGLDGLLTDGLPAVRALRRGDVDYVFSDHEAFFERVRAGTPVRSAIELLRGFRPADPDAVATVADAAPTDPAAVAKGLVDGFRAHTHYDIARYLAGAVQFNLAFDAVDLRAGFRDDTSFTAMQDGGVGMFCNEFASRAAQAFHAVPARKQAPPVLAGIVIDERHRHIFTVLASILRDDEGLVMPATFLDYTHSTLYDDLNLTGLLGEGLGAYNRRHRAGTVWWAPIRVR
ncbi:hypothetical protein [Halosegnis sp.]|uniref:hypothetical protein n=1 Tax=Halosegnis sp. TaxID=2864959 RepID=UPI0035D42CC3